MSWAVLSIGAVAWAGVVQADVLANVDEHRAVSRVPRVRLLLGGSLLDQQDMSASAERLRELAVTVSMVAGGSTSLSDALTRARVATQESQLMAVLWLGRWRGKGALFIYSGRAGQVFVRRLERGSNSAAEREELAIVVRASVKALLEGVEPELDPITAAEQQPAPQVAPVLPASRQTTPGPLADFSSAWGLEASGGYLGGTPPVDADIPWVSGVSVGLRLGLPERLFVDLRYGFLTEFMASFEGVSTALRRHPVVLGFGKSVEVDQASRVALTAALTLSVDRINRTTRATEDSQVATPPEGRSVVGGGLRVGSEIQLADAFALFAELGGEVSLRPYGYVAQSAAAIERRETRQLSANVSVGVHFELLGQSSRTSSPEAAR